MSNDNETDTMEITGQTDMMESVSRTALWAACMQELLRLGNTPGSKYMLCVRSDDAVQIFNAGSEEDTVAYVSTLQCALLEASDNPEQMEIRYGHLMAMLNDVYEHCRAMASASSNAVN